jgi:hypothetical protein
MRTAGFVSSILIVTLAVYAAAEGNPSTWLRDYLEPASLSGHGDYEPVSFCPSLLASQSYN